MDYTQLTPSEQYKMVQVRIRTYEMQKFDADMNRQAAQVANDADAEKNWENRVSQFDALIQHFADELAKMPEPETPVVDPGMSARARMQQTLAK